MKVTKTIKLYVGGAFMRSESGNAMSEEKPSGGKSHFFRYCQASPKDLRNAVQAALNGQKRWQAHSSYLRAQVLYRMAEMTSARAEELAHSLSISQPASGEDSRTLVESMIDSMVYYAGFADKYQQVASCINPVSGPFSHASELTPVGLVVLLDSDDPDPVRFCDAYCALLAGGNSVIGIPGDGNRWLTGPLAEIFATSDVPAGAANILSAGTGTLDEVIARHHEINAVCFAGEDKHRLARIKIASACNLKRVYQAAGKRILENIVSFNELRSVWHTEGF